MKPAYLLRHPSGKFYQGLSDADHDGIRRVELTINREAAVHVDGSAVRYMIELLAYITLTHIVEWHVEEPY